MKEIVLINRHFSDLNPIIIGEQACVPGHSFGPAVRKYVLIHYVLSGVGYIMKGEHVYTARAGEAFLILPDEVVTYCADAKDPWHYQWIGFDGSLCTHFSQLPCVFRFPADCIRRMLDFPDSPAREYRVAGVLFELYADLFDQKKSNSAHHYVQQVQDYIHALYMQPLQVEDLARKMSLDRRYLSRLFKNKTGMTLQEYLISVRMEEAKAHLKRGESVEKAARLCGYEDVCNFSKMFKRKTGVSPMHWKQAHSD